MYYLNFIKNSLEYLFPPKLNLNPPAPNCRIVLPRFMPKPLLQDIKFMIYSLHVTEFSPQFELLLFVSINFAFSCCLLLLPHQCCAATLYHTRITLNMVFGSSILLRPQNVLFFIRPTFHLNNVVYDRHFTCRISSPFAAC